MSPPAAAASVDATLEVGGGAGNRFRSGQFAQRVIGGGTGSAVRDAGIAGFYCLTRMASGLHSEVQISRTRQVTAIGIRDRG
jgi:hypothetical protein